MTSARDSGGELAGALMEAALLHATMLCMEA
jgi:hypothetical protein